MNENETMVNAEVIDEPIVDTEEYTDEGGNAGLIVLGGVALAAAGAAIASRTKWGKAKIKEIRTKHALKVLDKYEKKESEAAEDQASNDHTIIE